MHKHEEEPPDLSVNFEKRDIPFRGIAKGVVWFFAFSAFGAVVAFAFYYGVVVKVYQGDPYNLTNPQARRMMPQSPNPLLQSNITAHQDMSAMRAHEKQMTEGFGVIDQKKGIYRIPVERAMELTLQRGLPTRAGAQSSTGVPPVQEGGRP